ncbi:D-alanyl-D-alanine carboxypeptidase/D-alanyl-D-alanine-endopeptidase [Lysinibacillus sp. 2017]|uniref:D-alanyl-D-alanine carboxypeptidase/D-alanyl-D-alanine endopeptidase n=1 Tax=unclassified Lysinibacillus TaxID=2636778 RepID=UPI000D529F55|nr:MULTISPECIES: D-alanyl-D-alanine carboxypeptidase/D-alanyl-D-alanine-endopeptidase [unclassified Lysinibacillus]AWE06045.1 D-alanyl-D-alanine carboxypeptidase/D-alanyl-D-alanine-endopeptidase [Lysinibacillus sp. 2017]TGN30790.1 D-alanyl-D-alanine carboxypeptidase/D-alanyl-D-alanine-endopeptidase [Lysinibacillus sp. S2017]
MNYNPVAQLEEKSKAAIDEVVETILGKDKATLTLRDRITGELLFTYRGDHLMRSASNMKIISGAAALEVLGAEYPFTTDIYTDGPISEGVLNGNVYIKGSGDPTLGEATFTHFAQVLLQKGIHKITGQLLGDDTLFTGDTLPPGVDDEGETHYYGARVSAISMSPNSDYDASTIVVMATPKNLGEKPTFNVIPHLCGMQISNEAKTVAADQENTLEIRRINNTDQIVITGNLPQNDSAKVWVSLQHPTKNTLYLLKVKCEQAGIEFLAEDTIDIAVVPANAQLLYTYESNTVGDIFSIFMKLSNNSIADIFTKLMGKKQYDVGDYEAGTRVLKDYVTSKHVQMDDWHFVDGSGLSHGIRLNSNGLTKLLFELQKEPYFELFYDSLPVAGNSDRLIGGTLKERFIEPKLKNRIIAKTGYIHEVHTLSGYLTGDSGKPYIFSLLLEGREEGIPYIDTGLKKIIEVL